ncbi:MAG: DEAD/DEAH box helicase [Synergistaceae bacterium]|jgi:superfamily II DNA or RNA helicase|nr:DEAD/DEAH box helicase [Synergistaceae bacterium]
MIPRLYQQDLVKRAVSALSEYGNTLAVAPTGSGKTLMISWLLEQIQGRQMILQHREELVDQNRKKFHLINPGRTSSIAGLGTKDYSGETIFGMAQTLGRNGNMKDMPALDILVIDEAHHSRAETYLRIIEAAQDKNPDCLIAGFTATGSRGDKKGLKPTFNNVCDLITMQKLIDLGFLVPARTFIATLPGLADEIKNIKKTSSGEYDLSEVETLMDTKPINEAVFREWKNYAGDRKTIIFASTIRHAQDVCHLFQSNGIKAECVFGDTPNRAEILKRFEFGDTQVICNVAVLTEGYDCPPVSCVVLLRPCSFKSTMLQMIGRGLRTIDPEVHPGIIKRDCIVLDFGESLRIHGDLEQGVRFDDAEVQEGEKKECPNCKTMIPVQTRECPACGYEFPVFDGKKEKEDTDIVMMEVDLLKRSPFKWADVFGGGKVLVASGFSAWAVTASANGTDWVTLGKKRSEGIRRLAVGAKLQSLAAGDDFMRMNEDTEAATKSKRWLRDQPSFKQLELLRQAGYNAKTDFNLRKYEANCLLNFFWNKKDIEVEVFRYASN